MLSIPRIPRIFAEQRKIVEKRRAVDYGISANGVGSIPHCANTSRCAGDACSVMTRHIGISSNHSGSIPVRMRCAWILDHAVVRQSMRHGAAVDIASGELVRGRKEHGRYKTPCMSFTLA
jgi:hypothetical protein